MKVRPKCFRHRKPARACFCHIARLRLFQKALGLHTSDGLVRRRRGAGVKSPGRRQRTAGARIKLMHQLTNSISPRFHLARASLSKIETEGACAVPCEDLNSEVNTRRRSLPHDVTSADDGLSDCALRRNRYVKRSYGDTGRNKIRRYLDRALNRKIIFVRDTEAKDVRNGITRAISVAVLTVDLLRTYVRRSRRNLGVSVESTQRERERERVARGVTLILIVVALRSWGRHRKPNKVTRSEWTNGLLSREVIIPSRINDTRGISVPPPIAFTSQKPIRRCLVSELDGA